MSELLDWLDRHSGSGGGPGTPAEERRAEYLRRAGRVERSTNPVREAIDIATRRPAAEAAPALRLAAQHIDRPGGPSHMATPFMAGFTRERVKRPTKRRLQAGLPAPQSDEMDRQASLWLEAIQP